MKDRYTQKEYDDICNYLDGILNELKNLDRPDAYEHTCESFEEIKNEIRSKIVVA